ncbi:hypothetical protein WN51_07673 [Melipona quadrifasciata]|uniref:Uncharacterized protein n=1 Tax=Melipona quadrifasciata TaxID=166423 RepID=A0A0M8ZNE0_9HYME|nr:hypothetical protein WN51_07673 [Melipona quadrifasciata]
MQGERSIVRRRDISALILANCLAGKQGKDGPEEKKDADGELWGNVEAQAAFLGPNLWDKTLPYDADLKVLNHVCIKTRYDRYYTKTHTNQHKNDTDSTQGSITDSTYKYPAYDATKPKNCKAVV